MQHILRSFTLLIFFTFSLLAAPKILTPEEAFKISASQSEQGIRLKIELGEGIYLYDDKIKLELVKPAILPLDTYVQRPIPEKYEEYIVQRKSFEMLIPQNLLQQEVKKGSFTLKFSYQGCSELGICYQPMSSDFTFTLGGASSQNLTEQDQIAYTLANSSLFLILATFFGFGLLLALTPCVFPMIPILSSIIVSQPNVTMNAKRGFLLSLVYVLAMSLAYSIAGVLAGLFGANLQASMQNPWVIVAFSAIFVLLALSMFGFYEIKMPSFIQTKISKTTGEAKTQGVVGIAIMGFLSALIVGPCVAAPLAGALIYIGQSGDALLGGSALFVMSLGMGVPLLIIGTTAGRYMPRPGGWMQSVTLFFGVMLLAVALWMLSRILPSFMSMALWMLLVVSSAIYAGAIEPLKEGVSGWMKLFKSGAFILLMYGVVLGIGLLSGATDPLNPLEKLSAKERSETTSKTLFTYVDSVKALESELKGSKGLVMLDFYADWCVNCVEFEKFTFSDERVKLKMQTMKLLKADVTKNSVEDKAMQKAFTIYGPPAILFFKDGQELSEFRLVGFKNADEFLAHLEKLGL